MDVRVGLWRKLRAKELMLLNCGVGEDCKEIQPVHSEGDQPWISLEGMMLKLKLQYFGHLMRRVDSLEKTLMLGGIGGRRKRGRQRMRWLDGHESEWTPGVGDGQGGLACCDSWGCKESDMTELLNWTELNWVKGTKALWGSDDSRAGPGKIQDEPGASCGFRKEESAQKMKEWE